METTQRTFKLIETYKKSERERFTSLRNVEAFSPLVFCFFVLLGHQVNNSLSLPYAVLGMAAALMSCYAVFRLSPNVRERLERMSITFTEDSLMLRTNAGTRVLSYADIERIKVTEAPGSEVGVSSVSLFPYREKRVVLQGYEDMRAITSDLLQQTSAEVTKKTLPSTAVVIGLGLIVTLVTPLIVAFVFGTAEYYLGSFFFAALLGAIPILGGFSSFFLQPVTYTFGSEHHMKIRERCIGLIFITVGITFLVAMWPLR